MATLFIDYQQLVVHAYERKKVNNNLPHGLQHLTPANLKEECEKRCGKNLSKRDEKVIRDFCGDMDESRTCPAIIQRYDTDKFKPLVNFLKGKSDKTSSKNIELLAWLIDFPGRPWELGKTYSGDESENLPLSDTILESISLADPGENDRDIISGIPEIPAPLVDLNEKRIGDKEKAGNQEIKVKSTRRLMAAVMLSLVLGTGGMWLWKEMKQGTHLSGGCMYWNEDHYEAIDCNKKIPNFRVIALDTAKLKNFKKITTPDTITYLARGWVWYSKINGKIEFYTSGGEHPVSLDHRLKPITNYMIDKYILSGLITK